jgi:RNA polymerase sigma-70 factor, ECF subfamily
MTAHPRMVATGGNPSDAATRGRAPAPETGDKAERFRALALPYLGDVYTLARYLLRDPADAEDAAQECYLRAFRHFDTFRGGPAKPWLLAILRNVCRAEYARRGKFNALHADDSDDAAETVSEGLWSESAGSPEAQSLTRIDADTAQRLIADLPEPFRETVVLREINNLSYREIADVVDAPIGTVMSRLARGRNLLRQAWLAEETKA